MLVLLTLPSFTMASDLSEEEAKKLLGHLKAMDDVKPKVDTLADFQEWMRGTTAAKEQRPDESKPSPTMHVYTTGVMQDFPKISPFSGDENNDVAYDVWRGEVMCIIKEGHPTSSVAQAIRSSLRGNALHVRARLGPSATVQQILDKMDSVFDNVKQTEMLLPNSTALSRILMKMSLHGAVASRIFITRL